jgi:hypothetical protein
MTGYLRELYQRLVCAHCGKRQPNLDWCSVQIILHHPDGDGARGRLWNINGKVTTRAGRARLHAEVRRCIPLCWSCHGKEHDRMRVVAGEPSAKDRMIERHRTGGMAPRIK